MTKNRNKKQPDFIYGVKAAINDLQMMVPGDRIIAAVSGGPDSVALLRVLLILQKEYELTLCVAHLNHMLRGEESSRDEAFVQQLALSCDLPFYSKNDHVERYAEKNRLSIEEAGRELRYKFFDSIAGDHGYTKVATGHTFDDNAELVLMNLLRGAGPRGLSGIPPVRDKKYIRPLIQTTKKEILSFLNELGQEYMTDSSNLDPAYLRNRIRNSLIPQLSDEYNPEIVGSLNRLSRILRQEDEFMDDKTVNALNLCLVSRNTNEITLSKDKMAGLHPALLTRVFRKAIKVLKKDLRRISLLHMDNIVSFCFNQPGGRNMDLPGKIRIYKTKDHIRIKKEDLPLRELGKKEKQANRNPSGKNT